MAIMESTQQNSLVLPKKKRTKQYVYRGAVLVSFVALAGLCLTQHHSVNSLNAKISGLNAQNKSLNGDKTKLNAQASNLSNAVKLLQGQLTLNVTNASGTTAPITSNDVAGSENDPTAAANKPKAAGELTVTAVKDEPGTAFSAPGEVPLSGTVRAVYLTIKNTSGALQEYDWTQFKIVTDNGEALDPRVYPGPSGQKVWNNSKLVDGGSQNIVLLFGTDKNLVSVAWTAPGGTATINAALPAPQQ